MIRTDSEFLQYAMNRYDNPHMSAIEEFSLDLKRFNYINNLIKRYIKDPEDLKDRLIINHIVILGNCFTVPGSIDMLKYRTPQEHYSILETFLFYMELIEEVETRLDFQLLNILQNHEPQ